MNHDNHGNGGFFGNMVDSWKAARAQKALRLLKKAFPSATERVTFLLANAFTTAEIEMMGHGRLLHGLTVSYLLDEDGNDDGNTLEIDWIDHERMLETTRYPEIDDE